MSSPRKKDFILILYMYYKIEELLNEALQEAFMEEVLKDYPEAESLDIFGNKVVVCVTECTECYYGNCLFQKVIIGDYSIAEVEAWRDLQWEKSHKDLL